MPDPNPIEEIRKNVACDKCGYNLRGLRGTVITCPECGWQCDMVKLVARRWTKPWWKAPDFNALVMPTAWLVINGWISLITLGLSTVRNWGVNGQAAAGLLAAIGVAGWAFLLTRVSGWWPGSRGTVLSVLTFVVLGGYLLAVNGGIVILLYGLADSFNAHRMGVPVAIGLANPYLWIATLFVVGEFLVLMAGYAARRLERWIATQCITRYLAGPADN